MAIHELNEGLMDQLAIKGTYAKLFELILGDFVSREDMKEIMKSSNLPVSTTVTTTVNTAVTGAAGPVPVAATGIGSGNGTGNGKTIPIYNGAEAHPRNATNIAKQRAIKNSGGVTSKVLGEV